MTTKEVDVTTEQIETQEVTFCDSCGATEDVISLHKNPKVVHETEGIPGTHVVKARPDGRTTHTNNAGRMRLESDGAIDACETCLCEQFNEDVVLPSVLEETHETGKSVTSDDTDDAERIPRLFDGLSELIHDFFVWPWYVVPAPFDFSAVMLYWFALLYMVLSIATL